MSLQCTCRPTQQNNNLVFVCQHNFINRWNSIQCQAQCISYLNPVHISTHSKRKKPNIFTPLWFLYPCISPRYQTFQSFLLAATVGFCPYSSHTNQQQNAVPVMSCIHTVNLRKVQQRSPQRNVTIENMHPNIESFSLMKTGKVEHESTAGNTL